MRTLYGQRREVLLDAVARRYGDTLHALGSDAGLHLVTRLPDGADDRAVAQAALERNIVVRPLSGYYAQPERAASGLLLGYACVPEDEIATAFAKLAEAIDERGVVAAGGGGVVGHATRRTCDTPVS
jgi:GntR family transcriptional regulator/MocR family aminotransferase